MALRAKIVLLANLGRNNSEIADELGVSVKTARKWRGRFGQCGLEGLYDEPRCGCQAAINHESPDGGKVGSGRAGGWMVLWAGV